MSNDDDIVFGYSWKSRSINRKHSRMDRVFLFASQTLNGSIDAISEFPVISTTARTIFSERGIADRQ
jgi:hypothetical protein